MHVNINAIEI